MRTLLLLLLLIFTPTGVWAQAVDELGPTATADNGPSRQTSEMLQPTSPSTLQNLQGADSIEGGIPQVSNGTNLQSASGQTEFNNFVGPAEAQIGQKQPLPENQNPSWTFWFLIILGLLGITLLLIKNPKPSEAPHVP